MQTSTAPVVAVQHQHIPEQNPVMTVQTNTVYPPQQQGQMREWITEQIHVRPNSSQISAPMAGQNVPSAPPQMEDHNDTEGEEGIEKMIGNYTNQ